ncbi:MAG: hypothetical protein LBG67_00120 [Campylobacteraceae bacterium]|jgi:hypothetical protein|nr:hypothetical protein [Campylobacteraceae bacterium]
MKKILVTTTFISAVAFAQSADPLAPENFRPATIVEKRTGAPNIQDFTNKEFYLNIKPDELKNVQELDNKQTRVFDRIDDALINYKPVIKPLGTMDSLSVHPYYISTILLPVGSEISHVDISTQVETLKADQNTILLRTKMDFQSANMAIIYKLNGKNQVLNLLLKRYENRATETEDKLNLVLSYRDAPVIDDVQVIATYIKMTGTQPTDSYSYIYIDDILYRIIQDDKYGKTMINNKKYRVDTGTAYR